MAGVKPIRRSEAKSKLIMISVSVQIQSAHQVLMRRIIPHGWQNHSMQERIKRKWKSASDQTRINTLATKLQVDKKLVLEWVDQAADRRSISTVFMLLSPVEVDGTCSVSVVALGVKLGFRWNEFLSFAALL